MRRIWRLSIPLWAALGVLIVLPAALAGGDHREQHRPVTVEVRTFQLVGFTSAALAGDSGLFGLTLACQAEFAGSRICTSREILETVEVPTGLSGDAWVQPLVMGGRDTDAVDVSGARGGFTIACGGDPPTPTWSGGSVPAPGLPGFVIERVGLTVDSSGRFVVRECETARSVACCAPSS